MINIIPVSPASFFPLNGCINDFIVAGSSVSDIIRSRFRNTHSGIITVNGNFIPSPDMATSLAGSNGCRVIAPDNGSLLAANSENGREIFPDDSSLLIIYPWDLLVLNESLLAVQQKNIQGTIRESVFIDGLLQLGKGSILLPGVYIEGNVFIGENCKIGPNCYIRGNTSIGNNCHIGQAVEIKNSILGSKVSIGHLSYVGDSIIDDNVNFGAGTVIANLRHDGKDHKCMTSDGLVSTNRRKFGAIVGSGVHTGINTTIYPGRIIPPGTNLLPGSTVK